MGMIMEKNQSQEDQAFAAWCDELLSLSEDFELTIKDGLRAEVELQPARWLTLGLNILQSSKVMARVQLSHGVEGAPLSSILPYPVFQMGAEIFLKGMWLCQFDELRRLKWDSYIDAATRNNYEYLLGGPTRGAKNHQRAERLAHDLLKILSIVRQVPIYRADAVSLRFLKVVEGIVRRFYFPFYKAGEHNSRWAAARYPKRFYDDAKCVGRAETYFSYPPANWIARVFEEMKCHLHHLWEIPG